MNIKIFFAELTHNNLANAREIDLQDIPDVFTD